MQIMLVFQVGFPDAGYTYILLQFVCNHAFKTTHG